MNPKITVYITNFNYGQYLEQAIDSVLDQTFQDFELLIIDDGSNDNSMDIIKRYEKKKNIFVIVQKNKGLNVSNNIALRMARGAYFLRLDADDYLDSHCLEIMMSKLQKESDVALVFPDYYEVDEKGEILKQVRRHDFSKDVSLLDQPAHGACTMIRTQILREIGGYDESFNKQDGYDIWLKMIDSYNVSNINLPLFYYRKHNSSLSSDSESLLKTRAKIKEKRIIEKKLNRISVLAVIPTRGNKMDPRSMPLRELGGKKLIDWTIERALETNLLDNTVVTTPDEEVINHIYERYGDEVITFLREEKLARINTAFELTIIDVLKNYEKYSESPDAIMTLSIDYPFKCSLYFDKAIHTLQLYEVDGIQSVIVDDGFFFEHDGGGLNPMKRNNLLRLERDVIYRKAGGIQLYKRSVFSDKKLKRFNLGHIIVDDKVAFELKNEFEWEIAKNLIQL